LPGVKLVALKGGLKEKMITMSDKLPVELGFFPNYAVLIYVEEYINEVKSRITDDGSSLPDKIMVEPTSITKQVVFSLILAGRVSFKFGGTFNLKEKVHGKTKTFSNTGYSHSPTQELSGSMQSALLQGTGQWPALTSKNIIRYAQKLDRYYRSGLWWNDRLSMSLAYIWESMCSPFSQQSFIGLTNALEALISTTSQEITHILAERIALLTETSPLKRREVYDKVKELYKVRSKIVHGSVFMKKGRQTTESLVISPKYSNVPQSMMKNIANVTMSVIISALSDQEFLSMIQVKRKEEKINLDVNDYFVNKLFGG